MWKFQMSFIILFISRTNWSGFHVCEKSTSCLGILIQSDCVLACVQQLTKLYYVANLDALT